MSKTTIRPNIFETNSSSSHSLTVTSIDEFNEWQQGMVYFNEYDQAFVAAAPINEEIENTYKIEYPNKEYDFAFYKQEWMEESACYSIEGWNEFILRNWHSGFNHTYTSKAGETIIAFGYYGRD